MSSQIKAIISDADGTLVNTLYLIRHGQYETAVEYMLEQGIPRHHIPEYEIYETFINQAVGGSTRETFERTLKLLFGNENDQHLSNINFEELNQRLDPTQDRIAPLYVHPFYGLTELFSWLGKTKLSLGIFTSGSAHHIVRNFGVSLPALGYTELFRQTDADQFEKLQAFIARAKAVYGLPDLTVVTCDDVTKTKPDPEGILKLLDNLDLQPEEVVVLGDHAVDVLAAHNAGVHAIGISHGFGTPAQIKEAGALRVVDSLNAVPGLIQLHNSGESRLF